MFLTVDLNFCQNPDFLYLFLILNIAFKIVTILVPIIVMYRAIVPFAKAVISGEETSKYFPGIMKSIFAAFFIFMLPSLLTFIFSSLIPQEGVLAHLTVCFNNGNLQSIELYRKARQIKEEEEQKAVLEALDKAGREHKDQDKAYNESIQSFKEKQSSNNSNEANGTSSSSSSTSYGPGDSNKRSIKTVTIKGRTYDMYLQTDFPDVAFDGQNLSVAGCSAVAFTMAASGFDRNITVWDGAKLTTARSFTGIISALNSKGIAHSGPIYYNSNDYNNTANGKARAQAVVEQVREHLNQGKPVIAIVNGAPYAGANNHFITLFGEDESGNLISGNCRKEVGSLEELVANSLRGGQKGFLLVG